MTQNSGIPRRVWLTAAAGLVVAVALLVIAHAISSPGRSFRDGLSIARALPASPAQLQPGAGRMRHGPRLMGGGGTITAINGSTLTLRTMQGTQTVTTSGSTQYTKERQTISFSDLKVGDIVHVVPAAGQAQPASPGTGTIAAARIVVVEPVLVGRVTSLDGDTVNLVGRYGQELTVTLTGATRYYNGASSADRSAVTAGSRIAATGSQDSLTHLTADVVTVLPAGTGRGGWTGRRGGFGPGGTAFGAGFFGPGFGPGAGPAFAGRFGGRGFGPFSGHASIAPGT